MRSASSPFKPAPLLAAGALLCLAFTVPQAAYAQVYFGQDLNGSGTVRLTSTPNSNNARSQFFSNLTGTGTENFEGFAAGSTAPLNLTFPGAGTAR